MKWFGLIILIFVPHLLQLYSQASRVLKYNYVFCELLDKEILDIEHCHLKVLTRTTKVFQIRMVLKKPLRQTLVHYRLMKKLSGWRPYLFDFKIEFCDYCRNPYKYMVAKWTLYLLQNYTSAIHKCPYTKGEVFYLNAPSFDDKQLERFLNVFPFEIGEYGIFLNFFRNRKLIMSINGSFSYADYSKLYK